MAGSGYGRYTGDPSVPKLKRKRTLWLADRLANQGGLGAAYNSSSKPSKSDRYAQKPIDPTQGGPRHQSGVAKASAAKYSVGTGAPRKKKRRKRTGDGWIG